MPEINHPPSSSTSRYYLIGGLFLLWLLVRGISFGLSHNYSFDAVSRTTIAEGWLKEPRLIPYGPRQAPTQYAPLPIYLMGLSLYLVNQPHLSPRLVSLLFGCFTLLPLYLLLKLEFDRRTALWAALFGAFFSLHIKSSVVAGSEAIFCFFLLCGVYQTFKFKRHRQQANLILAAVFINLAVMSRYTGLIYIPLLGLLILDRSQLKTSLKSVVLFSAMSLLFFAGWLWLHYNLMGDALYPLKYILSEHIKVTGQFRGMEKRLYYFVFWPIVITLSLTPFIAGLSVMGMLDSLREKKHLGFLCLIIGPYLFFMYRSVVLGNFFLMPRFVIDSSIFLLPFAVIGMEKLQPSLPQPWRGHLPKLLIGSSILWLLLLAVLSHSKLTPLAEKMRAVSPLSLLEPGQTRTAAFLKNRPSRQKIILDHNPTWGELELMFYASLPKEHFITNIRRTRDLIDYLKRNNPEYLILLPQGQLSQGLDQLKLQLIAKKCGLKIRLIFNEGGYRLYQLITFPGKRPDQPH